MTTASDTLRAVDAHFRTGKHSQDEAEALAWFVSKNLDALSSDALAKELEKRLFSYNGSAEEADAAVAERILPIVTPTRDLTIEHALEHSLSPDDIWPDRFVEKGDNAQVEVLLKLAAAVAYDFDMDAMRELRHALSLAGVHSHFPLCASAAQLELLP